MKTIVLDIETTANVAPDMEGFLYDKKFSKITVPEKVRKKGEEAISEHIEEKASEIIPDIYDRAPLKATTGKIVCLGLCIDGEADSYHLSDYVTEKDLLGVLWGWIASEKEHPRLVTFNGMAFDLPFCLQRSWLLGVPVPAGIQAIYMNRYDKGKIHFDIMKEWTCGVYGEYVSLKELCIAFGATPPVGDGSDIPKLYEAGDVDAIIEHNMADLVATWEVYQKMEGRNV